MTIREHLGKTWVIQNSRLKNAKMAGGICVCESGVILTSGLDILEIKLRGRNHDSKWYSLSVVKSKPNFDLILLQVDNLPRGTVFPFFSLEEGVEVRALEPVHGFDHSLGKAFQSQYGYCSHPFPALPTLPDMESIRMLSEVGDSRAQALEITLSYLQLKHVVRIKDKKVEQDAESGYARHMLHPDIPIIEVDGFRTGMGTRGCPVFNGENQLVGIYSIKGWYIQMNGGSDYVFPLAFLRTFLKKFLPNSDKNENSKPTGPPERKPTRSLPDQSPPKEKKDGLVIVGGVTSNTDAPQLAETFADAVQARAEQDKNHGVILLPEGLIESIPEVYAFLQEIHGLHREGVSVEKISSQLSPWASALFEFLPPFIRKQLLLHPESDNSAQLSQIETEKLLAHLVETKINKRLKEGTYKGKKFNAICDFFGYQARGSLPSKFDCDYAYVLGHICYHILAAGLNGYLATITTTLKNPVNKWKCGAAPLTAMMTVSRYSRGPGRLSVGKPAINPATIDLNGKAYELLRQNATRFLLEDIYRNPGPLQFDGPGADSKAVSLCVEDQDYMGRIKHLKEYLDQVAASRNWIN